MTKSFLIWCKNIVPPQRLIAFFAMILTIMTCSCATTMSQVGNPAMCDVTKFEVGHPDCLPPPGFFCVDPDNDNAERTSEVAGTRGNLLGQLFPSQQVLGSNQPECPPNATRLIQDMD